MIAQMAGKKYTMKLVSTSDISPSFLDKNNTEETTTTTTTSVSTDTTTLSTSISTSAPPATTSITSTNEATVLNSTITSTSTSTTNFTNSTSGFFMSNSDNEDNIIYIACGTVLAVVVLVIVAIVIYVLLRRRKRKGLVKPKKDYPIGSFVKRKSHVHCEIEKARPQHLELGQQESLRYQNVEGYVGYLNRNSSQSQSYKEHYLNIPFYPTDDGNVLKGDNSLYVNNDVVTPHYVNIDNTSDQSSVTAQPINNKAMSHLTDLPGNQSHVEQRFQGPISPHTASITTPDDNAVAREKDGPALGTSSPVLPTEPSDVKSVSCVAQKPTTNPSSDDVVTDTKDTLDENPDIVYSVVNKDGQHDVKELCAGKVNEYFILEVEDENSDSDSESNETSQKNSESKQELRHNAPLPDENSRVYFELEDEHEYESYSDLKENISKDQHSVRHNDELQHISRARSEKRVHSEI